MADTMLRWRGWRWAPVIASLLLGACSETAEDPAPTQVDPGPSLECQQLNPGTSPARLLTREQYNNTIEELLGDDSRPADAFPPENTVLGYGTNADAHHASPLLVEKFLSAAEGVAKRAMAKRDELLPCPAGDESVECATRFIREFGARAFRRPLEASEVAIFAKLFQSSQVPYGFDKAIDLVLQALLQSPQFLYRIDTTPAPTVETGAVRLGSYEIASRLSYSLWNSMPDDALFASAATDELQTAEAIESHARRMLDDPRAKRMSADFFRQWLNLGRLGSTVRENPADADLGTSWQQSVEKFLEHAMWDEGGGIERLFTSSRVYVDSSLAGLYGIKAPSTGFAAVDGDPSQRMGLLTQPGLLALFSHPDQSSPIQRGVFIREQVLCQKLQSPPPEVDQTPPDPDPDATTRERFAQHTEAPTCHSCHQRIDGLGFGLENFDHLGRYRAMEYDLPVDASGDIYEPLDKSIAGPYNGPVELAKKLAGSPQVYDCMATQWYRYTMGRVETEADVCSLDQVQRAFKKSGGDLKELVVALTLTDAFRFRPPGAQDK